jgi:dolichyl-diphosphooligosaccharide--protein glycosyltransferase
MSNEIDLNEFVREKWDKLKNSVINHFEEYDIKKQNIAHNIALSIIIIGAIVVRLFPLLRGWDPTIKAFDPHIQIRAAEYILDKGYVAFLFWKDSTSWYPFGRLMGTSMYVGVPIAITIVYKFLIFLGFNVTVDLAAYFVPVIFGTIGVYFTYLLAKETISARAGLIAALIMVAIPAYLSRSIAGFVDNESVGVLFTVMTFYYFMRALNRDSNKSAVMAGISMFLLGGSWGAFRFAYDLLPLYAMVIVLTGKLTERFLRTYITTVAVSTLLMILIPRLGGGMLTGMEGIAPLAFIPFLVLFGIVQNLSKGMKPASFRRIIFYSFIAIAVLLGGAFMILLAAGYVQGIGSKFISVLLPDSRGALPLIDSVSEHLPLAWGNLWVNLSTLVFFVPVGIYYAIKNPTERNLFIFTLGIVTIYFSGSMVRLMLLLAPAAAILTALAVDNLLRPYALIVHKRIKIDKKSMGKTIGGQNAFSSYAIVFTLLLIMVIAGVGRGATGLSIPEITPPVGEGAPPDSALTDWYDAFAWMRAHTGYYNYTSDDVSGYENDTQPPVMLSWWDYGYYITTEGETVTLVDNATTNSTQIGVVGTMLMYNETAALPLLYQYNVQYVLVVPAAGQVSLGSDIGKAVWMIRISEQYSPEFGIEEPDYFDAREGYQDKFYDSLLFHLMAYRAPDMTGSGDQQPPFISDGSGLADKLAENKVDSLEYFTEVFRSIGAYPSLPGNFPIIRIFKVNYPADIDLRVNEFNLRIDAVRAALAAEAAEDDN